MIACETEDSPNWSGSDLTQAGKALRWIFQRDSQPARWIEADGSLSAGRTGGWTIWAGRRL